MTEMRDKGEIMLDAIYADVDFRLNPSGDDCWHCGGDGEVHDCFDGLCAMAEWGCEDCSQPCPECRIFDGQRAKAIREEVIKSGDVDIAIAWLKSIGRWTDSITRESVQLQLEVARSLQATAPQESTRE